MRDGTGTLQAVVVKSAVSARSLGTVRTSSRKKRRIAITGEVRIDARAPGGVEIGVSDLEIFGSRAPSTTRFSQRNTASIS